tara:strand:+ start:916 stop:1029 length:114 start_codon:yes stop_codon:yes gene_type:complete
VINLVADGHPVIAERADITRIGDKRRSSLRRRLQDTR